MASFIVGGYRKREGERDHDGYRNYTITFLVKCDLTDGPSVAMDTEGLPQPGDSWDFGTDADEWAFCKLDMKCTPKSGRPDEPVSYYELEYKFSSKPDKLCKDNQIEDPILQPMKISGSDNKHKEEATKDRFGEAIANSAHEPIRGPHNEWDDNRDSVDIEQNVAELNLNLCASMRDCVNQYELWGMPPRCVKLSGFTWEKKFYGQCYPYYVRKFKFEIDAKSFDRDVLDEGSKVLNGKWDKTTKKWTLLPVGTVVTGTGTLGQTPNPNPKNPSHFIRYKDIHDENTRTLLDHGVPWVPPDMVAGCAQCPDGMPERLVVSGVGADIPMVYAGGCTWYAKDTTDPRFPVLDYNAAGTATDPVWSFRLTSTYNNTLTGTSTATSYDSEGGEWLTPQADWDCTGTNTMTLWSGPSRVPFITVSPEEAPTIHIEKYDEADFLLLGIPTVL